MTASQHVVIVGGGFGGLYAAKSLKRAPVQVTLLDRRNYHLFQPLLYQVATGGLSPANIAAPLRSVLRRNKNCKVIMGEVTGFDIAGRAVVVGNDRVPFDSLILAAGATNNYFGKPEWEKNAPGLKTIEEATEIRGRVLSAFECAERFSDAKDRQKYMTFVVVGGGATGVEMAGAVAELAHHTLRNDFRTLDPANSRIVIVEGHDRLLAPFHPKSSARAEKALRKMGVEIWTSAKVKDIQSDHVLVEKDGQQIQIDTATVIWGAGVRASPLGKMLADAAGIQVDRGGRVVVQPDLTIPGHPNIFVVGDMAAATSNGKPVPGVAQGAIQEGKFAAEAILKRLAGRTDVGTFSYWDKGNMATIGRNAAVAEIGWLRLSGLLAWLAWLFVHLVYLVNFTNRILVLFQWFYNYLTRNRSARLITGEEAAHRGLSP